MRRVLAILLCIIIVSSVMTGCSEKKTEELAAEQSNGVPEKEEFEEQTSVKIKAPKKYVEMQHITKEWTRLQPEKVEKME